MRRVEKKGILLFLEFCSAAFFCTKPLQGMGVISLLLASLPATMSLASAEEQFADDCQALTKTPHRLTGSQEYRQAADHVEERLAAIGVDDVIVQEFVTAQTKVLQCEVMLEDNSGNIVRSLPVLPMRPNGIIPPLTGPEGLRGPIYHAGKGTSSDFGARSPQGCVVVMHYSASKEWMRAFRLGALAVIFVPDKESHSGHVHYVNENANFPRFYLEGSGNELTEGTLATIHSRVVWQTVPGRNVLGIIHGKDPVYRFKEKEELVVLAAGLDSFGEVPLRSPGARGAASCAALLQVAEDLVRHHPTGKRRHILVAFLDGSTRGHAGATALYRAIDHKGSSLENRIGGHKAEIRFLDELDDLLEIDTPLAPQNRKHPARNELRRRLQQIAANRAAILSNQLYASRNKRESLKDNPLQQEVVTRAVESLQAEKDAWNNLRRALIRNEFEADADKVLNETLGQAKSDLKARRAEMELVEKSLDAELRISNWVGDMLTTLHISFLLGDRTKQWGMIIGNHSAFRGNRDVAGVYSKIQRTFGDVYNDLSQKKKMASGFEAGTVDASFNPVDLIFSGGGFTWSAPQLVHGGAMAGTLGIYNVSLCTVQEDLRREGTPGDTLDQLDTATMRHQAEQIGAFLTGLTEHHGLSQASSIESEQTYIQPRFVKDQTKGAIAMVRGQGHSINSPFPGVAVQVFRRNTPRAYNPHKTHAYDDFQVVLTDQNGAYHFGPLYRTPNVLDNKAFGVKISDDGRVTHVTDAISRRTLLNRLNLIPCHHGAVVAPPHLDHSTPKFMDGSSDGLLSDSKSNTGMGDGVAYWFCEPKIKTVKIFGIGITTLLGNGPAPPLSPTAAMTTFSVDTTDTHEGPAEEYQGVGIPATGPIPAISGTAQAAADLWRLDESRMRILRDRSVMNSSIEELHGRAEDLLLEMNKTESVIKQEAQAASAFLAERAVYTNVRKTMVDLVHAVLVLLGLSVPFAFVLERLLIGSVNVYKQIGWFTAIFALTFLILFLTHPAFSVSKTPIIIFLGFAILVLSVMVIFIIMRKFEVELKVIQGMTSTVHAADVSRLGTTLAAVAMGVSTMRRRPLRTFLTATTIILLTFTILCFASFGLRTGVIRLFVRAAPSYAGVIFHQVNWQMLPESVLDLFRERWGDRASICPRYWVITDRATAISRIDGTKPVQLRGILGMEAEELEFRTDVRELLGNNSNNFEEMVFITSEVGERLGISEGDQVLVGGHMLQVGSFLNPARLATIKDLDGSYILPVDFRNLSNRKIRWEVIPESEREGVTSLQRNPNWAAMLPDSVAIVSNANARRIGAKPHTVTLYTENVSTAKGMADNMTRILNQPLSVTRSDGVYRQLLGPIVQAGNFNHLLFPLVLGGLVVFGTMLGSVSDRQQEIYSFSALGLAPAHVASLFFAEAMVFSIIGGLGGYLLAQGSIKALTLVAPFTGLRVPEMNYSSTNAIITMLIVMATVLISAIYPAIKASRSANPGVMRGWRMPAPDHDDLHIVFPFTVSQYDFTGIISFLREHFENYSDSGLGVFRARNIRLGHADGENLALRADLALAPLDLGVTQTFELQSTPSEVEGIDEVTINVTRQSGQPKDWRRLNKVLLNDLRRQFLIWRSLNHEIMESYRRRTLETMKVEGAEIIED